MGTEGYGLYVSRPTSIPNIRLVVDIDGSAAEAFAHRWGIRAWSTDWQEAITYNGIDLIDICTPPDMHAPIGVAASESKLHVYCEKPVGRNLSETRELADAVSKNGVHGYVGYNYRWAPAVVLAKQRVADGQLGTIHDLHVRYQAGAWADPRREWSWRLGRSVGGGGALADQGSHAIDLAQFLAGDVKRVCGYAETRIHVRPDPGNPNLNREVENDDADRIADLAQVRKEFNEEKWVRWNLVRVVTTTSAFGCLAWALVLLGRTM